MINICTLLGGNIMRIHLACLKGAANSLLVNNMNMIAGDDCVVDQGELSEVKDVIDNYDVVLVGPQSRFKYDYIKAICVNKGKGCEIIDDRTFDIMDAKKILEIAKNAA